MPESAVSKNEVAATVRSQLISRFERFGVFALRNSLNVKQAWGTAHGIKHHQAIR